MTLDSREFELIALGHVLSRYRITGQLPKIQGNPFDLGQFKTMLLNGVTAMDNTDINININSVNTESNVTIINEDCDHEHHESVTTKTQDSVNRNLFKQDTAGNSHVT